MISTVSSGVKVSSDSSFASKNASFKPLNSLAIHFLSFTKKLIPGNETKDDFEGIYESACLGWSPSFVDLKAGVANFKEFASTTPGDIKFWDELKAAPDDKIFFVDLHFDEKNFNRLTWICEDLAKRNDRNSTHIVIITKKGEEFTRLKEEYEAGREVLSQMRNVDISIYEPFDTDMFHDRFVLFGGYYWHFGASAGGMHAGLNAYSGPWPDTNDSLRKLLDIVVKKDNSRCVLSIDKTVEDMQ